MKRQIALCCGTLGLLVIVVCFAGTCVGRQAGTVHSARAHVEQLKARFAERAGQVWFGGEELADDVCYAVVSRFAALRDKLFPGVGHEPLPAPSGADSANLEENDAPRSDRENARTG